MARRPWNGMTMAAFTMAILLLPVGVRARDTSDTRLLATPAITEGKIAFAYADDIWVADADGKNPRRLTSHPGEEQNPSFSPDGKHIAFTASYDGNDDVYVIPVEGGEPTRLTWHPGEDVVRGFTPDGQVLFSSQREAFSRRHSQFYTVGIDGGLPKRLPIPSGDMGAISPDGHFLAYTPLGERFRQWKNYRGGTASRIWVLKLDDLSHEEVPKPAGGCNDTQPMWIGETVYFLSDRDGEFNVYSYDRQSRKVARLTRHRGLPGRQRVGRRGPDHLRASRLDPHLRARRRPAAPAQDRRGGRPHRDPSPLRVRHQAHPRVGNLTDRQTCRARVSRRDRHGTGQEGRSAQPHPDDRRARAIASLVARRQVDRVFLRRPRRIRARRPATGRQGRGPDLHPEGRRFLRASGLVARWQEDRLH